MDELTVTVQADVNPTESTEKVEKVIRNLFGDLPIEVTSSQSGAVLTAKGVSKDTLVPLRNVLRRDRIRDAARKALFKGAESPGLVFYLNKQVAFAGHVSFSEPEGESPLGPVKVTVATENPRGLIEWLTATS